MTYRLISVELFISLGRVGRGVYPPPWHTHKQVAIPILISRLVSFWRFATNLGSSSTFSRVLRDYNLEYPSVGRSVNLSITLLGSGPEGVDDLCFHTYGEFSPPPGIGPLSWDVGLEDGIWASRLGSGPLSWDLNFENFEKIPHMCESIGHRPLRGPCPKRVYKDRYSEIRVNIGILDYH